MMQFLGEYGLDALCDIALRGINSGLIQQSLQGVVLLS
jgi:hypothetical protein